MQNKMKSKRKVCDKQYDRTIPWHGANYHCSFYALKSLMLHCKNKPHEINMVDINIENIKQASYISEFHCLYHMRVKNKIKT